MISDILRVKNRAKATRWLTKVVFGPGFEMVADSLDELSFWLLITAIESDDPVTLALALGLPLPQLTIRKGHRRRGRCKRA